MATKHPYVGLPSRQFWRSAISEIPRNAITDLASPKHQIDPGDVVGTAGSCFAQHIARNLRERGFNFLDVEPAPALLRPERYGEFGFNMYSARYGNIYTAAQLRQLVERAFRRYAPDEPAWRRDDRFFDPFRPTIEPNGFDSEQALEADRAAHLAKVIRLFRKIDVFVFTLGLTEAWRSTLNGAVFPRAPGVDKVGEFDPDRYEFVNFTFQEIKSDLLKTFALLRKINNGMRVLLTVSPVPLAATASPHHVLTATTYSKSVLRVVAGELSSGVDYIDYFPSYELITAPVFEGRAYEGDWREVRPDAVKGVMEHFFASFVSKFPEKRPSGQHSERGKDDVICDEAILANYANG